jgi:hypothetical protein
MNLQQIIQQFFRPIAGVRKVFSYAASRVRIVYWKLRGWRIWTVEAEDEERWSKCFMCPHADFSEGVCGLCGCPLEAKLLLASERCPDKRWARVKVKK